MRLSICGGEQLLIMELQASFILLQLATAVIAIVLGTFFYAVGESEDYQAKRASHGNW